MNQRRLGLVTLSIVILFSAMFSLAMAEIEDEADPYKEFAKDPEGYLSQKLAETEEEESYYDEDDREAEKKLGKAFDLARDFSFTEKIEFCHYMIESDFLKKNTNCIEYADDPNFEERSKNFMILKGYGLYK